MVLKDCSRCMVYTPKGKRFAEAEVKHTRDHISLYFDDYLRDTRFLTTVDFYDEQAGLVRAVCELTIHRNPAYPKMPQAWMADCIVREVKDVVQRQQDIRARVHIEVSFKSEFHGTFYGVISNISAGGLYVVTRQPLNRDERIAFKYSFGKVERVYQARALRAKRTGDEYGYGCCFIGLTDNAEATIREYVFKTLKDKERGKKE